MVAFRPSQACKTLASIYPAFWVVAVPLFVRRFLLVPDLGRCNGVGDEKRSDSLDNFPRVVGARGKRERGERAGKR